MIKKSVTILLLAAVLLPVFALPLAAFAQTTPPAIPAAPSADLCGLTKTILDTTGISSLLSSLQSTISGFITSTLGSGLGFVGIAVQEVPVKDEVVRSNTGYLVTKESTCDPVFRFIAAVLIRSLTDSIIGWIQGGEVAGGNVGFIGNFEEALRFEADARGGEFLNNLAGINLCGNIGAFLQIALRTSLSLQQRFQCTVTDIVENVEDFFADFNQGGWPAFIRLSLQPQNNPYGAYLLALDAKAGEESSALLGHELRAKTGIGYEGEYITIDRCTDTVTSLPSNIDPNTSNFVHNPDGTVSLCYKEKLIKTPGHLVAGLLQDAFKSNIDFAVVADEVNEAIEAIILALIDRLTTSGEGVFSPDAGLTTETGLDPVEGDLEELTIITAFLPVGTVGVTYSAQLSAINGVLPYSWSIIAGALPAGLTLDIDGLISGTPTTAGVPYFTVEVTDAEGTTDTEELYLEIVTAATPPPPPPGGTTPPPPAVTYDLTVTPLVCNTSLPTNLVSWDPYPDATSYTIFSCQGENCVFSAGSTLATVQAPATTYSHLGVFTNTSYTYALTPFVGSIQSSFPGVYPEADITTDSCP